MDVITQSLIDAVVAVILGGILSWLHPHLLAALRRAQAAIIEATSRGATLRPAM